MALTYRQLIEKLKELPDERLDDAVTVYLSGVDEFYALVSDYPFVVADSTVAVEDQKGPWDGTSVLDDGHPYLVI